MLIRPVFLQVAASFLNPITITTFLFALPADGYGSWLIRPHNNNILHTGYAYELPSLFRPSIWALLLSETAC